MKLVLAIEGLFVLAATGPLAAQPEVTASSGWMELRVAPLADTFVRDDAGANYGDRKWLEIGGLRTRSERWSFLKFDTSAAAHVSSARLRLYGARSSKGLEDTWARVLSASSSWREHGLGSTFPAYVWKGGRWHLDANRDPLDRVKLATDKTDRWYEWDVSAWVVRERAAGRHVVTLALVSEIHPSSTLSLDAVAFFHSREAETNPPELVLVP